MGNSIDEILETLWEKRGRHSKLPRFIKTESITEATKAITQAMLDALPKEMKGCPSHDIPSTFCSSGGCLSAGFFNQAISEMESAIKKMGE